MTPAGRQALAAPVITGTVTATLHLPVVQRAAPRVLIAAAHIDSALSGEADEALMLWNPGPQTAHLAGWRLEANNATATFPISPAEMLLAPGASLWCTGEPAVFRRTFGFSADCEWGADDDPNVLNLEGDRLRLTNGG
ncbi:MAG: lamin tail domain-containing protein, partial [Caldilineae bacterium]